MKNKGLLWISGLLALAALAFIVYDLLNSRIEVRSGGDFTYDVQAYKQVNPAMISHKEVRQLLLDCSKPGGVTVFNNEIYFTADNDLYIVLPDGKQKSKHSFQNHINALTVLENKIILLFNNHLEAYNSDYEMLFATAQENEKTVFTSLVVKDDVIFVADAGNKRIVRYHNDGSAAGEFKGAGSNGEAYGFIIPSAYFDMDVNRNNELWIVNTGIHTLQHYSGNGDLKTSWQATGINIEGFAGCCNPAHFCFQSDGSFVTSEKGMVRVKIYDAEGKFVSVVAPPKKFIDQGHAPDVAVLQDKTIVLLDYDNKMLRFFEPKE